MGWGKWSEPARGREISVLEVFPDFRIGKRFGQSWMAQECVEFPFTGKGLQFGIWDDDRPRDRFPSLGIQLRRGFRPAATGDEFGQRQPCGVGERVEQLHPVCGNVSVERGFHAAHEIGRWGGLAGVGMLR